MQEAGADTHIITRVDDIAWLLNMRADDIPCFPVALCYAIDQRMMPCFISMTDRLSDDLKQTFAQIGVRTADYDAIYEDVKHIRAGSRVLLDKANTNYRIVSSLPQGVDSHQPSESDRADEGGKESGGAGKYPPLSYP